MSNSCGTQYADTGDKTQFKRDGDGYESAQCPGCAPLASTATQVDSDRIHSCWQACARISHFAFASRLGPMLGV
eukprot:scaffold174525_cov33-Tisochrysis_lutea.AAC.3